MKVYFSSGNCCKIAQRRRRGGSFAVLGNSNSNSKSCIINSSIRKFTTAVAALLLLLWTCNVLTLSSAFPILRSRRQTSSSSSSSSSSSHSLLLSSLSSRLLEPRTTSSSPYNNIPQLPTLPRTETIITRTRGTRSRYRLPLFSLSSDEEGDEITSSSSKDKNNDSNSSSKSKKKIIIKKKEKKQKLHRYKWTSKTAALALPALIGMLADPLLSLMDTAYVGRLGSATELAALGACTSIFHLAFNAFRATTAATTSLVGNADADSDKQQIVRISLSFGIVLGVLVGAFLQFFGPWCLSTMGVSSTSALFPPASAYLKTRSWAAPAVLAITVAEGAFRGYGDTKIPLLASLVASIINLILDPILMLPPLSKGVQGAAAATAAAQIGALAIYFYFLRKRRMLPRTNKTKATTTTTTTTSKRKVVMTILGANLAMVCKQGSLLLAWAYATARATRIGSAHVAAHQVALSCWLVFALIQDGAGVAAQVLLTKVLNGKDEDQTTNDNNNNNHNDNDNNNVGADNVSSSSSSNGSTSNNYNKVRSLMLYMLRFSFLQGFATTGALLLASPYLPKLFVPTDLVVQGHLTSLLPHVAWQQLLVSLTLVTESLAIGGSQFRLLAIGTSFSTVLAVTQLRQATTVVDIWSRGIVSLFAGRLVTALIGAALVLQKSRRSTSNEKEQGATGTGSATATAKTKTATTNEDDDIFPNHFPG